MPVTIVKAKAKPVKEAVATSVVAVTDPKEMTDEQLADYYGSLREKVEALEKDPAFAKFEAAKKALKERLSQFPPDAPLEIKGESWQLEAGACSKVPRSVSDVMSVMKFVGIETFAKIAKVNVSDVEAYLTPDQAAQVLSGGDTYTANRKIKAVWLGKK